MFRNVILIAVLVILSAGVGELAATEVVSMDLFKPFRIRTDGENLYIGQEASIFIYSAKDYKLLQKFGKPGEGPQEFKLYPEECADFDVQTDIILAFSVGKLSFFSKKGKFLKELKVTSGGPRQFYRVMGKRIVGEYRLRGDDKARYSAVAIFGGNLESPREIFRWKHQIQPGKQFDPIARGMYTPNFYVQDNKIFIGGAIGTGEIHVFDTDGKPLYVIRPKVEKVKFTDADKKGYIESYSLYPQIYEQMKNRFLYPDYFPLWQNFIVTGNRIYLQTYKRDETDKKNLFLILSLKGDVIEQVWLPLDEYFDFTPCPYTIHGNKLYQTVDNEDAEAWELHITQIK